MWYHYCESLLGLGAAAVILLGNLDHVQRGRRAPFFASSVTLRQRSFGAGS